MYSYHRYLVIETIITLLCVQGCADVELAEDGDSDDTEQFRKKDPLKKCGNGKLNTGEECDDRNIVNNDGCSATCQTEECGDGIVQPPGEQCDDGNTVDNDGCSATCQTERFTAVGPQVDVPAASLVGWTTCFTGTYDQNSPTVASVLAACNKANLMLACRPVGAANFTLLAHAPRVDVITDTGMSNTPTNSNGSGWYFNDSWSWGFAKEGDPIVRTSCDVASPNPTLRLCWHTNVGSMQGGWRCGSSTDLNSDPTWERMVLHAD